MKNLLGYLNRFELAVEKELVSLKIDQLKLFDLRNRQVKERGKMNRSSETQWTLSGVPTCT